METLLPNLPTKVLFPNENCCMIVHFRAKYQQSVRHLVLNFGHELIP